MFTSSTPYFVLVNYVSTYLVRRVDGRVDEFGWLLGLMSSLGTEGLY